MRYPNLLGALALVFLVSSAAAYNFSISTLQGVTLSTATSLQFGPDHRLYVAQVSGQIKALTVQRLGPNNYQVTATENIDLIRDIPNYNDDGTRNTALNTRQVTGILVVGTGANPVIYVSSSDPRIGGGSGGANDLNLDTNSGVISRLTRSGGAWSRVDLVRGLPRSEENHASNGMQLDPLTNTLYLAQGGNTNAGGPSNNFAFMCETALSAAILSIDLDAINAMPLKTDAYGQKYLYDLPTVDDPNPARAHNPNGSDVNDPFGGNDGLNQARIVAGGPVQVYSSGYRNPYDLVIMRTPGNEGRMYTFDNAANPGWGGYPHNEGTGDVTNQYVEGEGGFVNNRDNLHRVTAGFYAGHPNPIRANPAGAGWLHFDASQPDGSQRIYELTPTSDWPPVPVSMANPVEGDYRQPGLGDGALLTYPTSTNGLAEYIANNFNGEMRGNLIAAAYDGKLLRIALDQAGTAVTNGEEILASSFGPLPLDVTTPDPGHGADFVGTIWVCHFSPAKISVLEPADFDSPGSSTCTGINSFDVDEDGDGYSNADEITNDSDPCSAAVRPPDADEDNRSDLLDPDDDNDGIPDVQDPFPIDSVNGASVPLPLHYELFNETGIGFFGVGVTGLMMNRGQDYLPLISPDNAVAGGTSGLFTLSEAGPGRALGSSNNQKDAYHFAFNSDQFTTPYVIESRLGGPFFGGNPTGNQTQGIYLGTGDQDNYISVALHANGGAGGIEVIHESEGTVVSQQLYPVSGIGSLTTVDLFFTVDPVAAVVQPGYRLGDEDPIADLGAPISVTGPLVVSLMGPDPLAVGLFASTGASGTPGFSATWDYFSITPLANTAIAKFTIDSPATDMSTSSTYTNGAFQLQNLSTGGQHITSISVDLSTAIFPDSVFDPDGTAGDPDHKAFQPNSSSGGVAGPVGVNSHPNNGLNGADGYNQLDVDFTAFPPGGSFAFSIDVDPTSVKGVAAPGQNNAASVSGIELIGSTATVFFSDGSVHRTRLGRLEGTLDGSYGWLRAEKPPKPGLFIPGRTSPRNTAEPEIVRVTGPAGLDVTLTTIEGALYVGGVPGGGYDLDPFEANTAIKITEATGVLPAEGYLDFTVTPTRSNSDGGYNYITAVLSNAGGVKGPASDAVTLYYDPASGSDTQPPSAPGPLTFTAVTSSSATVNWTAATDNVGVTSYRISRGGLLVGTVAGLTFTDSGLTPGTTYTYSVLALDAAGNTSTASVANVTTLTESGGTIIRVNAGGPVYVDSNGNTWSADTGYNTGATSSQTATIGGTNDPYIYYSNRYDGPNAPELRYRFELPNGTYTVRLHFTELFSGLQAPGKRVFDIDVQSVRVFENVDIFVLAGGGNKALILETTAQVTAGQITIDFLHQVENPKINGIEIIPATGTPPDDTEPPSAPGSLTFTDVADDSVTVNWGASTDNIGIDGYRVSRDGAVLATVTGLSFTDATVEASTSYTYSVVAFDDAGNESPATTGSVTTPDEPAPTTAIRVNAGGPSYVDSAGKAWMADTGYNTGATSTRTSTIANTSDPFLYYSNRFDSVGGAELRYQFDVPNGDYLVRLHFVEVYDPLKAPGKRVFDIDVQSARAFDDVDIFVLAGGGDRALVLETEATVSNGRITIDFLHQVENPKINAIEILAADAPPPTDTQPPSAPGSLAFSDVTSSSATVTWGAATDNVGVTGYRVSRNGSVIVTVAGLSFTDASLEPATNYSYSVVALDEAGNASAPTTGAVTTLSASPPAMAIRVNAGGPAYTDSGGDEWSADTGYNTGSVSSSIVAIANTSDPFLYYSNRFDGAGGAELRYQFDVPNGSYTVRLHFAEIYGPNKAPGKRVFDIDVQSARAFDDVDIFVLAGGGNRALILETEATVTNGRLTIDFLHQVENPKINAIEILSDDPGPPADSQPPSIPGSLTFTSVGATQLTVNWTASTDNVGVTGYRISRNGTVLTTVAELSFTDTGLAPATSYNYSVVALDSAGNASPASTGTIATASGGPPLPTIRVNAGGGSYVDSLGNTWQADTGYNTGGKYTVGNSIANTNDPTLFRSERYDSSPAPELGYAFTVPNGSYLVRLYFAEIFSGAASAGARVFDVDIEGQRAFEDVDVFVLAGGAYRATMLAHTVSVTDGQLNIGFVHQAQNPKISAIEILPAP